MVEHMLRVLQFIQPAQARSYPPEKDDILAQGISGEKNNERPEYIRKA